MRNNRNLRQPFVPNRVFWKTLTVVVAITVLAAAWMSAPANAAFPDKPLTVVVPYKAGGSTDTMIRVLAGKSRSMVVRKPI